MFMMKNTLLWVSKTGFNPQVPSFCPTKVSRVCFTSASKNLNQFAKEDAGGEEDAKAAERLREARKVYGNDREAEEVEKKYKEMKQKAGDTAQNMKEKAQEEAQQAGEAMQEAKDKAKDSADKARKKAGEAAQDTKEWTKDTADWTADKAKEGAGKATEAMHNVGEKAKETAKGAWESAKGATQKIKETVVGKGEDVNKRVDEYVEDHVNPKRPDARDEFPPTRPSDARDRPLHRDGP
ncbi:hypothetical protein KSS87_017817 [Heliosperma pusillum]|nr:hypothetical protein KSS87_017817 [Heliosperma pusillum]